MEDYLHHYESSVQEPDTFWRNQAKLIDWFKFPETISEIQSNGTASWYGDGIMNTSYLCLDYHVAEGRGDQIALIYDSPVTSTKKQFTYSELLDLVSHFAGGLRAKGLKKGDRVIIYMPMIPESAIAMLACARLGLIHSVVFGGFAAHELAMRMDDAEAKAIITADFGVEIDRVIPYHPIVKKAIDLASLKPDLVVSCNRHHDAAPVDSNFVDFYALLNSSQPADYLPLNATDPLYILYTSGTTGKPKGVVRENGGHAVALRYSMSTIYGLNPGEVFWAASDIGWVVGHSYIVYGPLINGSTTILFEGKPIKTPDAGTFWRIIDEYQVSVFFTAPTAIRAIRKEDPELTYFRSEQTRNLRALFLAGERCDVATLAFSQQLLQKPVIDHWWQTESGWPMIANSIGIELLPIKPGSSSLPVAGYTIHVLNEAGEKLEPNTPGFVAIKLPLPPGCATTLWGNDDRFRAGYLDKFPGYYFTGDGGYIDEEGYVFITGRVDDVINVAGHRLSTSEMEEIIAHLYCTAECAVIGGSDELKGEVPIAFVVLKDQYNNNHETHRTVIFNQIREEIGAVASLKQVYFVTRLPKTRSGKILRNLLRSIVNKESFIVPGTIEDENVIEEIQSVIS
jgi:acyl-coenzyme A synthetase/AMP-(fatty) acid ligase